MGFQFSSEGLVVELSCPGELTLQSHRQETYLSVADGQDSQVDEVLSYAIYAVDFANLQKAVIWLRIIPVAGPLFSIVGTVMLLVATWLALQESLRISKWRALLIPLVALIIVILAVKVINLVASGAALTVDTILAQLGLLAG